MSIGYGGRARIVLQDKDTVIYEYAPYDLNEPAYRNSDNTFDGLITISKHVLVTAEIRRKVIRMPGGKKKCVAKRIRRDIDYASLFAEGKIIVENSRFCWQLTDKDCGLIAIKLIRKILNYYQEYEKFPEMMSVHY